MAIKNLGLVKALFVGENPPLNESVIWLDTGLTVPLHKYYNTTSGAWIFCFLYLLDDI